MNLAQCLDSQYNFILMINTKIVLKIQYKLEHTCNYNTLNFFLKKCIVYLCKNFKRIKNILFVIRG